VSGRDPARAAYSGAGEAWSDAAILAYGPMAQHLIDQSPIDLSGRTVLDAGAGTGAAGALLAARGAAVLAADIELDMLRANRATGVAVVADINALPLRAESVDACVAAFVLNHVPDPVDALRELRNVTRAGGVLLASVFSVTRHASKKAVEAVAIRRGWTEPAWYQLIQSRQSALGTVERVVASAGAAGFTEIEVNEDELEVGLDTPELVVRYRLLLPQFAGFLNTLSPAERHDLAVEAIAAVAQVGETFRPAVIELVARVD
jgi:SAM-dependent methyltransferase